MSARPLNQVWSRYVSAFRRGVQTTSKENLILYDGSSRTAKKVGTIPKDAVIHVGPINAPSYISRIPVTYRQGNNDPVQGWVKSLGIRKPSTGSNRVSFSLKPQDFPNVGGTRLSFSDYYDNIIGSINNRSDLPDVVKNYLIQLVEYCNTHSQGDRTDLVSAYSSLSDSAYSSCVNLIIKDFSELIAPICVLHRGQSNLERMGFSNLSSSNATIFVPTAGNYPLVDFIISDSSGREYPFSVKALSNTTNVIKPQDILEFVKDNSTDKFIKDFKKTIQGKVLEVLGETSKGVAQTSYETVRLLAEQSAYKNKFSPDILDAIPSNASSSNMDDAHMQQYANVWQDMAQRYYPIFNSEDHLNNVRYGGSSKNNARYNQVSLIMQLAIQSFSDSGVLTYRNIIVDYLMSKVSYYKFGIRSNGMPEFVVENNLFNNIGINDSFKLRAKSYKSSPVNDRVGIQP